MGLFLLFISNLEVVRFYSLFLFNFFLLSCNAQDRSAGSNSTTEVFEIGGHQASFPGGEDSLLSFMKENLELPKGIIWEGKEPSGVAYVQFKVDTLGLVSDVKIIKSVHPIYDKAIIKMMKKMPRWIPDTWKDEKYISSLTIPIQFGEMEDD